ncbi:hypothetical protein [Candidatus Frankia alpina]|uniref:Uncharacterized protein n=1 Tax=Candidatus Frankia alpina TaxID=2699483 RepID=A0A4S5BJ92_9ACTN|nr:hypothetical protein [Candidatus Frankia alpina]THJ30885.1 hypothetical protein E7Y31_22455 [Candidatus Frankia alpina]
MQVDAGGLDERLIVKTRAAKALTAAVVIGGTLFATGGTSFAAGNIENGKFVTATGTGPTFETAENEATLSAADQCQSGVVTTGSYNNNHLANGTWTSTYKGRCASAPPSGRGDR